MGKFTRLGEEFATQLLNPTDDSAMYQAWLWVLAVFPEKEWSLTMQSRDGFHCHGITIIPKDGNCFGIRITDLEARDLWGEKVVTLPPDNELNTSMIVHIIREFTRIKIKK